jgi:hypothetical protein
MDLQELKTQYYFFAEGAFGDVYIFVDFGNVRHWAKELWPEENKYRLCAEIDIAKLADVCSWVHPKKKFFYYGYFPKITSLDKNNHYNTLHGNSVFRINKAKRCGFLVQTKEIKMIPHYNEEGKFIGKLPKCNFDVEITKDKKIIVVCTRNRMSTELQAAADKFIPAETLSSFLKYERADKTKTPRREAGV